MRQPLEDVIRGVRAFHSRQSLALNPRPFHLFWTCACSHGRGRLSAWNNDQLQPSRSGAKWLPSRNPRLRALRADGTTGGSKFDSPPTD